MSARLPAHVLLYTAQDALKASLESWQARGEQHPTCDAPTSCCAKSRRCACASSTAGAATTEQPRSPAGCRGHSHRVLVLTRRAHEQIVVTLPDGRRMRITIADLQADRVRVAFDAPDDVTIHRAEVQHSIDAESASARHGER